MSTDSEDCSDEEKEETRSASPLTRAKESLQYIIFDYRNSPLQPVRGRLLQVTEPQVQNTNHEALLADELQDKQLDVYVLSTSEMESIFGKSNINSNTILKYAKLAFIREKKSETRTLKIVYSERLTKFGTCLSEGECLLEDASDLMAFSISPSSHLKSVLETAHTVYQHSSVEAFFMRQKLLADQTILSQVKQDISMIHLVLQKPIQIQVMYPLEYNRYETLIVECYNTDTFTDIKYKLIEQFPDLFCEVSNVRLTQGIDEKDGKEAVMTLMRETETEFCGISMLRYPSKKQYHQWNIPVLHRAPLYFHKIIIKHASKEISTFVDSNWSTIQLREEIAKLTHCYPQSLNLFQLISRGMQRQIPETESIDPYVKEDTMIRTGIREKVELMITVKDRCGMKRFIIYMYDLNTTEDLRLEISTQLNVDVFYIDLFHGKSALQSSSFKNLGFRRKEEIRVEVERNRIRIRVLYVNTYDRRKNRLIVDDPEVLTVQELLEFWAVQVVCEDSSLRIIFENQCLMRHLTLHEANITHGSTICICKCPSAFENTTVPGKIKGIIEANDTGEMDILLAVTLEGMAFYSNKEYDYEPHISKLQKQRSEERKARKMPPGIRLDSLCSTTLNDGILPPSTPKLISFPSIQNKMTGDDSPTIHGGEYSMFSPMAKRKIDFSELGESPDTTGRSMMQKINAHEPVQDTLSCKTFPQNKARKRYQHGNSSITYNTKRTKFENENLPVFQELLDANKRGQVSRPCKTETKLEKVSRKKAYSVCEGFGISTLKGIPATLVKQSSNTTKLYSVDGTPGLLRTNSHIEYDYIPSKGHMHMTSHHGSPRLVELEQQPHPGCYAVDTVDGQCSSTKKGISEKTLHGISKIVTCRWKNLARELELETPTINKIDERSDHDVVEKIYQTLLTWKQKAGTRANLKELVQTFRNLEQNETAEKIQEMITE